MYFFEKIIYNLYEATYCETGPYFREMERGHGAPKLKQRPQNESGAPKYGPKLKVAPPKIEASAPRFAKIAMTFKTSAPKLG